MSSIMREPRIRTRISKISSFGVLLSAAVVAVAGAIAVPTVSGVAALSSAELAAAASLPATSKPTITISGFKFSKLTVKKGKTVTIVNRDMVTHSVTSNTGRFNKTVGPGKTVTFKAPSTPGTYKYHCSPHRFMKGTLTVVG